MLIQCCFHEDTSPSCSINLETGVWVCYAGCGGGSWMDFLERVRKDPEYAPLVLLEKPVEQNKEPVLRSLLQRGFTREILAKWGVVWDKTVGAMRLPVLSREGTEQGNIWRYPKGIVPKYRYEAGFAKSETLYGLWRLPVKCEKVVLVEGPLDAIWVQEAGIIALAILGSSLSEPQVEILTLLQPKAIVLCFDADTAGKAAEKHAIPLLRQEGFWVYRTSLPVGCNDIQEVKNDRVNAVIGRAELCVNSHGMIHPRYQRWLSQKPKIGTQLWR